MQHATSSMSTRKMSTAVPIHVYNNAERWRIAARQAQHRPFSTTLSAAAEWEAPMAARRDGWKRRYLLEPASLVLRSCKLTSVRLVPAALDATSIGSRRLMWPSDAFGIVPFAAAHASFLPLPWDRPIRCRLRFLHMAATLLLVSRVPFSPPRPLPFPSLHHHSSKHPTPLTRLQF